MDRNKNKNKKLIHLVPHWYHDGCCAKWLMRNDQELTELSEAFPPLLDLFSSPYIKVAKTYNRTTTMLAPGILSHGSDSKHLGISPRLLNVVLKQQKPEQRTARNTKLPWGILLQIEIFRFNAVAQSGPGIQK